MIDPTMAALASALRGLSAEESAIGANVANADTPGYQPVSVDFQQALQEQLSAPASALLSQGETGSAAATTAPDMSGVGGALALKRTDPRHLGGTDAMPAEAPTATSAQTLRNDGNAVDVDAQMSQLVDTQLRYAAVGRLLTGKLGMLKDALGQAG